MTMTAVRVETRKFTASRLWWLIAVMGVLLIGGMSAIVATNVTLDDSRDSVLSYAYSVPGRIGYLFPLLIGALIITNEYRHRTLSRTLLNGASRRAVVLSKAFVVFAFGVLLGVLFAAVGATAVALVVANGGGDPRLTTPEQFSILLRTPLAFGLWALVGLGFGLLLRNQVAAIVTILAFTLIVEPVLTSAAGEVESFAAVGRYLPGAASMSFVWPPDQQMASASVQSLGWESGGLVLLGYGAVLILFGFVFNFRNRDVI